MNLCHKCIRLRLILMHWLNSYAVGLHWFQLKMSFNNKQIKDHAQNVL